MTKYIIGLQLVLVVLKLAGNAYVELYSWWWILSPTWLFFRRLATHFFSFFSAGHSSKKEFIKSMQSQEPKRSHSRRIRSSKQATPATENYTNEELDLFHRNSTSFQTPAAGDQAQGRNDRIRLGKIQDYERLKKVAQGWRLEAGRDHDREKIR